MIHARSIFRDLIARALRQVSRTPACGAAITAVALTGLLIPPQASETPVIEPAPELLLEAETLAADSASWNIDSTLPFASAGKYLRPARNTKTPVRLEHTIELDSSGVYYVFVRAWPRDSDKNSIRLLLDGREPDNESKDKRLRAPAIDNWSWRGKVAGAEPLSGETLFFTVDAPGKHVLSLETRHKEICIDAIAFRRLENEPFAHADSLQAQALDLAGQSAGGKQREKLVLQPSWAAIPLAAIMGFNIIALFIWVFFRQRPNDDRGGTTDDQL